jgi:hypothetical protein
VLVLEENTHPARPVGVAQGDGSEVCDGELVTTPNQIVPLFPKEAEFDKNDECWPLSSRVELHQQKQRAWTCDTSLRTRK